MFLTYFEEELFKIHDFHGVNSNFSSWIEGREVYIPFFSIFFPITSSTKFEIISILINMFVLTLSEFA